MIVFVVLLAYTRVFTWAGTYLSNMEKKNCSYKNIFNLKFKQNYSQRRWRNFKSVNILISGNQLATCHVWHTLLQKSSKCLDVQT